MITISGKEHNRTQARDLMEEEKLEDMLKMMIKKMGIYKEGQQKRGKEIKQEIRREMIELRKAMRNWETVRKKTGRS